MSDRLPFMPFYGFDYETDERTALLSDAEHGVYMKLLWHQWKEGSVPADPETAARAIRSADPKVAAVLCAKLLDTFFVVNGHDRARNEKLHVIRRQKMAEVEAKRRGGKVGRGKQLESEPKVSKKFRRTQPGNTDTDTDTRTTKAVRVKRETWLTPYLDAWKDRCGGDLPPGRAAKGLRVVHERLGESEAVTRWRYYLAETDAAFASPERFAATVERWQPDAEPMSELGHDESSWAN